jgi:hypothetical protein
MRAWRLILTARAAMGKVEPRTFMIVISRGVVRQKELEALAVKSDRYASVLDFGRSYRNVTGATWM